MAIRSLLLVTLTAAATVGQAAPKIVTFHKVQPTAGERLTVFESRISATELTISTPTKADSEPMTIRSTATRATVADVVVVDRSESTRSAGSDPTGGAIGARITYSYRHVRREDSFMLEKVQRNPVSGKSFDVTFGGDEPQIAQVGTRRKVDRRPVQADVSAWWAPLALHRVIPDGPVRVGHTLEVPLPVARGLVGALVEDDDEKIASMTLTLTGVRNVGGVRAAAFSTKLRVVGEMKVEDTSLKLEVVYDGEVLVATDSCRLLSLEATGSRRLGTGEGDPKGKAEIEESGPTVLSRKIVYSR